MAFIILAISQVVHSYNMRSEKSLFKTGVFTNKKLNYAALLSFVLVCAVVFIPPFRLAFGLIALPVNLYVEAFALTLVSVVVLEISKACGLIKHQK